MERHLREFRLFRQTMQERLNGRNVFDVFGIHCGFIPTILIFDMEEKMISDITPCGIKIVYLTRSPRRDDFKGRALIGVFAKHNFPLDVFRACMWEIEKTAKHKIPQKVFVTEEEAIPEASWSH